MSGADADTAADSADEDGPEPVPKRLVYVEFGLWVATLSAALVAGGLAVGLLAGDLVLAKTVLFVVGFLLLGLGAIEARPPPAWKDGPRFSLAPGSETVVDRLARRLPPLSGRVVPRAQRVGRGAKWLAASLVVLATSYAMETVFGVTVA